MTRVIDHQGSLGKTTGDQPGVSAMHHVVRQVLVHVTFWSHGLEKKAIHQEGLLF